MALAKSSKPQLKFAEKVGKACSVSYLALLSLLRKKGRESPRLFCGKHVGLGLCVSLPPQVILGRVSTNEPFQTSFPIFLNKAESNSGLAGFWNSARVNVGV